LIAAVLALLPGSPAIAQLRSVADVGLVGAMGGAKVNPRNGNYQSAGVWPELHFQLVRLGLGVEADPGIGIVVGTTLAEVRIYEGSFLPINAKVFWDFQPDGGWTHRTAYIFAAYHRKPWWSDFDPLPPYLEVGIGGAYTYYAITPKIELGMMPSLGPRLSLSLGFDIGGTYVFGNREGGNEQLNDPLR